MHSTLRNAALMSGTAIITAGLMSYAGPLDPPAGPVSSSYKTLGEVEPRTAINAANTPGNASSVYRITEPGSYFLPGNTAGANGKSGIEVAADGVTIDLCGFVMQGGAGSVDGIRTSGVRSQVMIRNGTISGWGRAGVDLTTGGDSDACVVEGIIASGNTHTGIRLANKSVVRACVVRNTLAGHGIFAATGATIEGCGSHGNNGAGIWVDVMSLMRACTVTANAQTGFVGHQSSFIDCTAESNVGDGFGIGSGCVLVGCAARSNTQCGYNTGFAITLTSCTAYANGIDGFRVLEGSIVSTCTASRNTGDGIQADRRCYIINNMCNDNGLLGGSGAGILVTGGDNRIERNNCTNADRGIQATSSGNVFIRNTCTANTTNWSIVTSNVCYVVVPNTNTSMISGNSGGQQTVSDDPNVNYSY